VDARPPSHVAARRRAGRADDPVTPEQFVQQVSFLIDLRAKAESVEPGDRIISGRADQIRQLHQDLSRDSQGIPGWGSSTGTGTDVDQVRSHPERNHRAELPPDNTGGPTQDEHARAPRVNESANLDAPVTDPRGIRRRGDFEPNRPPGRVIVAPGKASARELEQKHQTTGARGPSRVHQHPLMRLAFAGEPSCRTYRGMTLLEGGLRITQFGRGRTGRARLGSPA
jgi:hypothetical protein